MLAESLARLDESDWIDGIVVAAPPGWEEPAILVAEEIGASKVSSCVTGGTTRAESVRAALAEVPEDATVVLVHDAARPLLPAEVLERVLTAPNEGWDGAVPGLSVADTVKRVDGERVVETLDPDALPGLAGLRARGLYLGMAANQSHGLEEWIRDQGLQVDLVASSARWGVEKPSPEFFARVVSGCGFAPDEVAYVGDRVDNDV